MCVCVCGGGGGVIFSLLTLAGRHRPGGYHKTLSSHRKPLWTWP